MLSYPLFSAPTSTLHTFVLRLLRKVRCKAAKCFTLSLVSIMIKNENGYNQVPEFVCNFMGSKMKMEWTKCWVRWCHNSVTLGYHRIIQSAAVVKERQRRKTREAGERTKHLLGTMNEGRMIAYHKALPQVLTLCSKRSFIILFDLSIKWQLSCSASPLALPYWIF